MLRFLKQKLNEVGVYLFLFFYKGNLLYKIMVGPSTRSPNPFHTLHNDSYSSKVQFIERSNSIITNRMFICRYILNMHIFFTKANYCYPIYLFFGIMMSRAIRN